MLARSLRDPSPARPSDVHSLEAFGEANRAIAQKERALSLVVNRIADERRDERLTLAAGIHDEVLPPLYKVHLMGQVVKNDLASGRLLDLEADVPPDTRGRVR